MKDLIISLMFGVVIYLAYLLVLFTSKKGLKRFLKNTESSYILDKFKINLEYIKKKKYAHSLIITNTIILFLILWLIGYLGNIYLQILVAFALALPLIFLGYNLLGNIYKKKSDKKEEEVKKEDAKKSKETIKTSKVVKKTTKKTPSKKKVG